MWVSPTYLVGLYNASNDPCAAPSSASCKSTSDTTLALSALPFAVPLPTTLRQLWLQRKELKRQALLKLQATRDRARQDARAVHAVEQRVL